MKYYIYNNMNYIYDNNITYKSTKIIRCNNRKLSYINAKQINSMYFKFKINYVGGCSIEAKTQMTWMVT